MTKKVLYGGDALQNKLAELNKKIQKAALLEVGFPEGKKYPDGTPVAAVAAIQIFGAPRASIPPRPFFQTMIREKSPTWGKELAQALKFSDYDAENALGILGETIKSELQESIRETDEPALSQITLMLRKMFPVTKTYEKTGKDVGEAAARVAEGEDTAGVSTKPLVWTGTMINSIVSQVS